MKSRMAIFFNGKKFLESKFELENEFERLIKENSKLLFGKKTIYFDLKNKIDSKSLGSSLPDAFLFDFNDIENPEFYIVEIELAKHDFYKHIFPQITKFFAFFKNYQSISNLIEKLFHYIKTNEPIEQEFKQYLGRKEIYKALKDIIENSQNILLILDNEKQELQEVFDTYTDTWDKLVKVEILKKYEGKGNIIFSLSPDFENIDLIEPVSSEEEQDEKYTEEYHLDGVEEKIKIIYEKIKNFIIKIDSNIKLNPQKYYISLRNNKNFAFIKIKKRKMHIVIMLPLEEGNNLIKHYTTTQLSEAVQNFYNGPSFRVTLDNDKYIDEIFKILEKAYKKQNK